MLRTKILSLLSLMCMLSGTACTPQAVPPTVAPAGPQTLTVLAAASLTEALTDLAATFESLHPGVTVSYSFAGSQELAQQLAQGAEADVFASASNDHMEAAIQSGRVNADDSQVFVKNRLVVIFPKDNPGSLGRLQDLAKPGLKLDFADDSVPVGKYSLEFLTKATDNPAFDPQFKENVLRNVVSYETSVKAVLTKVALGEVDAGIVYVTDITPQAAGKVGRLEIPDALNTIATYPIAPISDSKHPDLAQAFVALVLSPQGQQVMVKYGFLPAAGGSD